MTLVAPHSGLRIKGDMELKTFKEGLQYNGVNLEFKTDVCIRSKNDVSHKGQKLIGESLGQCWISFLPLLSSLTFVILVVCLQCI